MDRVFGNTAVEYKIKADTSNSRGFVAMTLLILTPLFVSVFFLSFAFLLVLKRNNQVYFLCYKKGAKIQKNLQGHLKTLIRMNTQAKFLRIRRNIAEIRYKTALMSLEPFNISQAWQNLQEVKSSQKSFAQKQQSILQQAKISLQIQWRAFKLKSKKSIYNVRKTFDSAPLALRKEPSSSDSPDYTPVPNFSEKQKIKISWSMDGFALVPQSLKKSLGLKGISHHHCVVSLEDLKGGFQIKLMK